MPSRALTTAKFFHAGAGILPHAATVLDDLAVRDRLHRYVNHVRSSQAFAINLFGGLEPAEALGLWACLDPAVDSHDSIAFEFEDPEDELAEAQASRPHKTQVDVLLRGRDPKGDPHVALIEVKLTETGFGACSAFDSPRNPRRDICRSGGAWGGDPGGCFQLTNHDGPHRRRYDHFIDHGLLEIAHGPECAFLDTNQVMRNVALASVLLQRGEATTATVALCAPTGNRAVWRQWRRCCDLYAQQPNIRLIDLPAQVALAARDEPTRSRIELRYGLTEDLA